MRRALAFTAIVVIAIVVSGAGTASAQQAPTVRVSDTTGMTVAEQCFTEPTTGPGSFTLERSSTRGPITVTYHISGGPTDLNSDPVAGANQTVDFADGAATATVTVHPAIDAADATVTVVDDDNYDPGDPATGTIPVARSTPQCVDPSTTENTLARTGARSTSGPLAIVGITAIALGSLLLVLSSRRKMTGLR